MPDDFTPDMWDAEPEPEPDEDEAPYQPLNPEPNALQKALRKPEVVQKLANFRTIK